MCQLQRLGTQRLKGRKSICNSLLSFYTVFCTFFNMWLSFAGFLDCTSFVLKKTFPFMIFTFFSTKKPLVSTSFPLFCLIFHQKISVSHHFCISFVAPKAPKRAPKHQFCGSKGFQLTDPPFGKLEPAHR